MTAQAIESQRLFRAPLTIRYCENRMQEKQGNSGRCGIVIPAPEGDLRPVSHIENLGKFDALPAPISPLPHLIERKP